MLGLRRASRMGPLLLLKQVTRGKNIHKIIECENVDSVTFTLHDCSAGKSSYRAPSYATTRSYDPLYGTKLLFNNRFSSSTGSSTSDQKEMISVTFVDKDGEENHIKVPIGMSMLEAAHENDIELEGACEASLACSTCHVIVMDMDYYNKLEDPADEENDMLNLAFGLSETSRLGCQVIASPELDGVRLAIPAATRNFAVHGYVPKPH